MLWIILPLLLFVLFGMYVRRKAERLRAEEGTVIRGALSEAMQRPHVVVRIKLAGEGMATREELHLRQSIEDEIERRGIGTIADAGSGKGFMHLIVVVPDAQGASGRISEVLESAGVIEASALTTGP